VLLQKKNKQITKKKIPRGEGTRSHIKAPPTQAIQSKQIYSKEPQKHNPYVLSQIMHERNGCLSIGNFCVNMPLALGQSESAISTHT